MPGVLGHDTDASSEVSAYENGQRPSGNGAGTISPTSTEREDAPPRIVRRVLREHEHEDFGHSLSKESVHAYGEGFELPSRRVAHEYDLREGRE